MQRFTPKKLAASVSAVALLVVACSASATTHATQTSAKCTPSETPVLTFAAYSTPRVAYGKMISAFRAKW